jgi:steroid 5-alpha reductase family enzyme
MTGDSHMLELQKREATLRPMSSLPPLVEPAFWACIAAIAACWLLSVLTREYSWVDRLWSVMPPLYAIWFAWSSGGDPRTCAMAVLATLWGVRLTYNFARKGGYRKGGEDYRWVELRTRMSPLAFQVFNLLFTAGFQHLLVFAITLPAVVAASHPGKPFGAIDLALCALFLLFLVGETIADQQQWTFHQRKKARRERGEQVSQGFLSQGLFAYSRHPNFFCEQAQWWVFYALGAWAAGAWLNYTVWGPLLLSALFHGSTNFTEELSLRKYPDYAGYQRRVSRLIPWFPKPARLAENAVAE